MKIDIIRFFLRLCCLGLILGRFKKIGKSKNAYSRGFVNAIFPLPASGWQEGNDFLWETRKPIPKEFNKRWVIFFGYRTSSGWKAKGVIKIL